MTSEVPGVDARTGLKRCAGTDVLAAGRKRSEHSSMENCAIVNPEWVSG